MTAFAIIVLIVAVLAGATASVVGFGIGSLLTPLVAIRYGMPVAVALVSIPHAIATALRCWRLRAAIDWPVLRRFGVVSAAGGLAGAAIYTRAGGRELTIALGVLLILTAVATLTGWMMRWTPRGPMVWLLGAASGAFGGLAGNQGGIRAAAMQPFRLAPAAFVATATATGLLVDAARMPVYAIDIARAAALPAGFWTLVAIASVGVVAGTLTGERLLLGLSVAQFRRVLGVAIGVLGVWLLVSG
jgi:uncharacterized membrane protein YfcA